MTTEEVRDATVHSRREPFHCPLIRVFPSHLNATRGTVRAPKSMVTAGSRPLPSTSHSSMESLRPTATLRPSGLNETACAQSAVLKDLRGRMVGGLGEAVGSGGRAAGVRLGSASVAGPSRTPARKRSRPPRAPRPPPPRRRERQGGAGRMPAAPRRAGGTVIRWRTADGAVEMVAVGETTAGRRAVRRPHRARPVRPGDEAESAVRCFRGVRVDPAIRRLSPATLGTARVQPPPRALHRLNRPRPEGRPVGGGSPRRWWWDSNPRKVALHTLSRSARLCTPVIGGVRRSRISRGQPPYGTSRVRGQTAMNKRERTPEGDELRLKLRLADPWHPSRSVLSAAPVTRF